MAAARLVGEADKSTDFVFWARVGDVATIGTALAGRPFAVVFVGASVGALANRWLGFRIGLWAPARALNGSSALVPFFSVLEFGLEAGREPEALRARVGDGRTGRSSSDSAPVQSSSVGEGGSSMFWRRFRGSLSLAAAKMLPLTAPLRGDRFRPATLAGAGDGSPIWTSIGDGGGCAWFTANIV